MSEPVFAICSRCGTPSSGHEPVDEPWMRCPDGKDVPALVAAGIAPLLERTVVREPDQLP